MFFKKIINKIYSLVKEKKDVKPENCDINKKIPMIKQLKKKK
jgi:hypothetical protein